MKKAVQTRRLRVSLLFLRLACLLILAVSIALLCAYLEARRENPLMASYRYFPMVEYIFASALIACGGACLIEHVESKGPSR